MNQNAKTSKPSIDGAIDALQKKSVKIIQPSQQTAATPIFSYIRNALVGMALSYIERVDAIIRPVFFCAAHFGVLVASILHLFVPFFMAWFSSHWSDRMESAVWTGSLFSQMLGFFTLWLLALVVWSILWLGIKALLGKLFEALADFALTGETYLTQPQKGLGAKGETRQS